MTGDNLSDAPVQSNLQGEFAVYNIFNLNQLFSHIKMMFECPSVEWKIFFQSAQVTLIITTILVAVVTIYKLCVCEKAESDAQVIKLLKYLCIIAQFLCITAVGPGLGSMCGWLNDCNPSDSHSDLVSDLGLVCVICYSTTLTFLYAIFAFRLHRSVCNTNYQFTINQTRLLIVLFSIQFTVNIVAITVYIIGAEIGMYIKFLQIVCEHGIIFCSYL